MVIIRRALTRKEVRKLGNIIYYERYGIHMLRRKPFSVKNPRTPIQQAHRNRFKKLALLVRPIIKYLLIASPTKFRGKNAYFRFLSNNLPKSFTGDSFDIDPSKLVLCDNDGSFVKNVVLESTETSAIKMTFESNAQNADESGDFIHAYGFSPDLNRLWRFDQEAIRKCGNILLRNAEMSGLTISVYPECLDRINTLDNNPRHVIKYVGSIHVI